MDCPGESLAMRAAGLEVDNHCQAYLDYNKCRISVQTKSILLRGEMEVVKITESVKLDWDNGRMTCSSPHSCLPHKTSTGFLYST